MNTSRSHSSYKSQRIQKAPSPCKALYLKMTFSHFQRCTSLYIVKWLSMTDAAYYDILLVLSLCKELHCKTFGYVYTWYFLSKLLLFNCRSLAAIMRDEAANKARRLNLILYHFWYLSFNKTYISIYLFLKYEVWIFLYLFFS